MPSQTLTYVLAERPKGPIILGQTLRPKVEEVPTADELKDGEVLFETLYLSLDPAMRPWMDDVPSYLPPVQIGAVMRAGAISRVLASKSTKVKAGDLIFGQTGMREVGVVAEGSFQPLGAPPPGARTTDLLGVLGLTGLTAYFGLTDIGKPKAGETVVVSGAAGATGSVVGQMAKIMGARVVGIAGTDEKVRWLKEELGFDEAINYKAADFRKSLKAATPDGINVYWDNVGGEILDLALSQAAQNARFVICGAVSTYNSGGTPFQSRYWGKVITHRIRLEGFIVIDYGKQFAEARAELGKWLSEGRLKRQETVLKGGLKVAEQGLIQLFEGVNTGKLLVEVKKPEASSNL